MGWRASPGTLTAASSALRFVGAAWAVGFFAFLAASARLGAAPWGPSSLPFLVLASLAALLLVVCGVVRVFVALIMHLLAGIAMGWLPSSGGGNHPPRRQRGVSASSRRLDLTGAVHPQSSSSPVSYL